MSHPKVVKASEPGVWGVTSTQSKAGPSGVVSDPGGFPELRSRSLAAGALLGARPNIGNLDTGLDLVARCEASERMSVLVQDSTGTVRVIEGTGVPAGPEMFGLVMLARGTSSHPYRLDKAGQVLAVRAGFGVAQELSDAYHEAPAAVPVVEAPTLAGIEPGMVPPPSGFVAAFLGKDLRQTSRPWWRAACGS